MTFYDIHRHQRTAGDSLAMAQWTGGDERIAASPPDEGLEGLGGLFPPVPMRNITSAFFPRERWKQTLQTHQTLTLASGMAGRTLLGDDQEAR
jgi:hypothetical protein